MKFKSENNNIFFQILINKSLKKNLLLKIPFSVSKLNAFSLGIILIKKKKSIAKCKQTLCLKFFHQRSLTQNKLFEINAPL